MHRAPRGAILALLLIVAAWARAAAQTAERAYCNIVAVEHKALTNAVQVTIRADGLMAPDIQSRQFFNIDAARMGRWDKMGKRISVIPIRINNARSRVGSIVHVGVYPVSHVEVSVPPEAAEGIGVDIRIVLHKPAVTREIRLAHDRWNFQAQGENPPFISIEQSQDRRSIVVVVVSDRRVPEPPKRRALDATAPSALDVRLDRGKLTVYALNTSLRALLQAIGSAASRTIVVDPGLDRGVSLYLDHVDLDEALQTIRMAYGLSVEARGDTRLVTDAAAGVGRSFSGTAFASVPLQYISAKAARDSLPDFLLNHVQTDAERNALTVVGSPELVEKVRADLVALDKPIPLVEVRMALVEFSDSRAFETAVSGRLQWPGGSLEIRNEGQVTFSSLGRSEVDFTSTLQSLTTASQARIRAETTTVVLSGRTARLFSGQRRQMPSQYFDFWRRRLETRILTLNYGTLVEVTPWTSGEGIVIAQVRAEVSNVTEVDRATGNPTLSRRSAESTVRLQDGETIMIGGLEQEQDSRTGHALGLAGLLSRRDDIRSRPRLAVFLTAKTIKGSIRQAPQQTEERP